MSEADDQTNLASPKSFNSSNSTASAQAIRSCADSHDQSQSERAVAQHLSCLLNELEAYRQTVQCQQILIETLTAQLESSQERVAKLERECSLAQGSHNKQSHQLIKIENTCRELRTRLTRQQRHTLQLKVALEKCTEVPVASYHSLADTDVISFTTGSLGNLKAPYSPTFLTAIERHNLTTFCLFKAQPIPPWSAQLQFLTNDPEPVLNSPSSDLQNIWAEHSGSCFTYHSSILNWSAEYLSTPVEEEPLLVVETSNQGRWEEIASCSKLPWKCTSRSFGSQAADNAGGGRYSPQFGSSDWREPDLSHALLRSSDPQEPPCGLRAPQAGSADYPEESLFDPLPSPPLADLSEPAIDLEVSSLELDTAEAEAHKQELFSLLKAVEELLTTNSPDNLIKEATVVAPSLLDNPIAQLQEPRWQLEPAIPQLETSSAQVLLDQNTSAQSPQLDNSLTSNTKLPSAVVYPLRPPKGRKSLAEIELPPFS